MTGRSRDRLPVVQAATRDVLARAATADPPLRARTWRVLAAVLTVTATWTRLEDHAAHGQLGALCGLDKETDRRNLRRELHELHQRRLIVYTPGRSTIGSRRVSSVVALPPVDADRGSDPTRGQDEGQGVGPDPGSDEGQGVGPDPDRGSDPTRTGGRTRPPSLGSSLGSSLEENRGAPAGAAPSQATAPPAADTNVTRLPFEQLSQLRDEQAADLYGQPFHVLKQWQKIVINDRLRDEGVA